MPKISTFAAAALGALLVAQPVIAATTSVDYHDLDLSTKQGRDELDKRLVRAAREVCRTRMIQTGSNVHSWVDPECVKRAIAQSREQIAAQTDNNTDKNKATGGGSVSKSAGASPVP